MSFYLDGFTKAAKLKKEIELQPHQKRTVRRLERVPGVLAYHGLGSGKTLTSIAATAPHETDVVVPASLRENYKKELKKFTTKHKSDVKSFEKFIKDEIQEGRNLVVDEAHLAGSAGSRRSLKLREEAKKYNKRILLTGTPVKNRPDELVPILAALRPDEKELQSHQAFKDAFLEAVEKKPGLLGKMLGRTPSTRFKIKNKERFRELVRDVIDYHGGSTKDFPSTSSETVTVPMDQPQSDIFRYHLGQLPPGIRHKVRKNLPLNKKESKGLNNFLAGVRQTSNTSRPYGGEGEAKLDRMAEEIFSRKKKDKKFKAVVYSNYLNAGVRPLSEKLEAKKIPHAIFDGSLKDKERKEIVEKYNKDKIKALLLTGAGAQGLDLKGTKLIQIMEPHWNSPRIDQAIGRGVRYKSHAHLPKKDRHVHIQRFHAESTPSNIGRLFGAKPESIDRYLENMAREKDELNNQFLDIMKEEGAIEMVGGVRQ
jgi:SNF2 family DNA or RNA helicase